MKKMEEATLLKVKKWIKIISYITGSLSIIVTPLLVMYVEWVPKIRAARGEAEASYEAMAPAVVEIQGILKQGKTWSESVEGRIATLEEEKAELDRRVSQCEGYMEEVGKKSGMPAVPTPGPDPVAIMNDYDPDMISDEPPVQEAPRYQIPVKMSGAKARVNERKKFKCAVDEPLCGSLD